MAGKVEVFLIVVNQEAEMRTDLGVSFKSLTCFTLFLKILKAGYVVQESNSALE